MPDDTASPDSPDAAPSSDGMQTTPMNAGAGGKWQPPSVEDAAQLFPQYEVLGLLGRGGMGAVYQAKQLALDRLVAIKLLPLEVSTSRDFADRFTREARTMGKLNHPHIISVYDFGQTPAGHLYIAMEFVEGTNLHEMIHGPGLTPAQTLTLIGEVCDALAYAHGKGVVHRDIKPANVMVNTEGRVKVADFGLARLIDPSAEQFGHTVTGIVMGTPDYMAPEQKRAMNVDHRADIYSLGVMLYEMLCKETPQGIFDPPSARVGVDTRVDEVVMKAMAQAPDRRFQSSTEMKVAVERIRTTPLPRPSPKVAPPPPARSRMTLYVSIAAVVLVLGALGFLLNGRKKATAIVPATPRPKATPIAEARPTPATPAQKRLVAAVPTPPPTVAPAPPTPTPAVPEPTTLPVGGPRQTFGLIGALDLTRDRVKAGPLTKANNWSVADGKLTYTSDGGTGKVFAPVDLDGAREYSIELEFRPLEQPTAFTLCLPVSPTKQAHLGFYPGSKVVLSLDGGAGEKVGDWPAALGTAGRLLVLVKNGVDGRNLSVVVWFRGTQIAWPTVALADVGKAFDPHPDFPGMQMPSLFCLRDSYEFALWTLRVFEGTASKPVRPAAPPPPTPETPIVERTLFDGQTFTGWHNYGNVITGTGWRLEARALVSEGKRMTLVTNHPYADFELSLEWRASKGGNGGIYYLIDAAEPGDRPPDCPEMNLQDDALSANNQTGSLYNVQEATKAKTKPIGQWNTAKLVHRAGKAEHWINGDLVLSYDLKNTKFAARAGTRSKLGLQGWVGEIAYRNITVRDLTAPAPALAAPAATPAPASKAAAEVVKWLDTQVAAFTADYQRDAIGPFDKAVAALRTQYLAQVARGSETATKAGKLDDAIAWKNEQTRLDAGQQPHDVEDAAADPAALKQLRENWRKAFAKLDAERFAKAKVVFAKLDLLLDRGQTGYTQKQRLDDALLLKTKRDELRAAWLTPPVDFSKPAGGAAVPSATPKPLGSSMTAPKPGGDLLTGREAILHLHQLGYQIDCLDPNEQHTIFLLTQKPEDLPRGRLEISYLTPSGATLRDGTDSVTDADFAKLGPMRRLGAFGYTGTHATGTGFAFLADSPELVSANLHGKALTDAALVPLLGARKLTSLVIIGGDGMTWARVGEMQALPSLDLLAIAPSQTFPPAALARARKLQTLTLTGTEWPEGLLGSVASLPDLQTLTLIGVGPEAAPSLQQLEKSFVKTLTLQDCVGLGANLGFIGKMRKLSSLTVNASEAPDLAVAAGAPALRELTLYGGAGHPPVTDAACQTIATSFPRLERLTFWAGLPRTITPEGLRTLAKLPKLRALTWGQTPITTEQLAVIATWPALDELGLAGCGMTDEMLAALAPAPALKKLDLSHTTTGLTTGVTTPLKAIKPLRDVMLYNCAFKPAELDAIQKAVPKISVRDQ